MTMYPGNNSARRVEEAALSPGAGLHRRRAPQQRAWSRLALVLVQAGFAPLLTLVAAPRQGGAAPGVTLFKNPPAANLFIGGPDLTVTEEVAGITSDKRLGAFELQFLYSKALLDASVRDGPFLGSTGRATFCSLPAQEGSRQFSCVSGGPQPGPPGSGVLAVITVSPKPGLLLRPTSRNGAVLFLDDLVSAAELADTLGQPIPIESVGGAANVLRALEGGPNGARA